MSRLLSRLRHSSVVEGVASGLRLGKRPVLRTDAPSAAGAWNAQLERTDEPCPNCDDRKCMGCIFRDYDHECADDCPFCCSPPSATRVLLSDTPKDCAARTSTTNEAEIGTANPDGALARKAP